MNCPKCGGHTKVIDSRENEKLRRRRKECIDCFYRFTTVEMTKEEYKRIVLENKKIRKIKMLLKHINEFYKEIEGELE